MLRLFIVLLHVSSAICVVFIAVVVIVFAVAVCSTLLRYSGELISKNRPRSSMPATVSEHGATSFNIL